MVKNLLVMWETWVQSLGWEDPLEEGMATHSSILARRIPMEKKCKKSKMAVWGGLTNSCEKKRGEKQRRKSSSTINEKK